MRRTVAPGVAEQRFHTRMDSPSYSNSPPCTRTRKWPHSGPNPESPVQTFGAGAQTSLQRSHLTSEHDQRRRLGRMHALDPLEGPVVLEIDKLEMLISLAGLVPDRVQAAAMRNVRW